MENKIINYYKKQNMKKDIKLVCFDCFDTILHRYIHTDNIKMKWAKQVCHNFQLATTETILYQIRKESENELSREKSIIIKEYSYRELIEQIFEKLKFKEEISISFKEFYQITLKIELDLEEENSYVDEESKVAIEYFIKNDVSIAIISDFYFSGKELVQLLHRFGIFITNVYVSSDFGKGKYSGELYKEIFKLVNLKPDNILMIGDNRKSDILSAKINGMQTFYKKWNGYPVIKDYKSISKELLILETTKKRFPYENYSFVLYYFIDKLYQKLKRDRVRQVLFLAREGEMLKALFDKYADLKGETEIKTFYFYTSRISSFAAGVNSIEKEDFRGLFNKYNDLSILTFLKSLGWENNQIEQVKKNININIDKVIFKFPNSPEFKLLKSNPIFVEIYNLHRIKQNKMMKQYLEQMGVNYTDELNIVDVGWRGSIQDNLFACFQKKVRIHGYYIGISKTWENFRENMKEGLIFSDFPLNSDNKEIWNFDKFMFERILLASHPTTIGYKNINGQIYPILKEYINDEEAFQYISPLQERIKELFTKITNLFAETVYQAEDFKFLFTKIHLRMLCKIGINEVIMQKKLYWYNYESFGEFGRSKTNYFNELLLAARTNKIPMKNILKNGINLTYIQSISITTLFITHGLGWLLPIMYRIFYFGELRRLNLKSN